ncbi:hypothetical protein [Bacteriovorax sp. BSW11_IV]|uniref:hypothetical protein n=1 Tax=Bacteriovorax sp. BSW11_IV TaxID=1353529 RepID=UPI00054DF3F7|nr:hypothetical protein [Bacteriovorax sp. BSW11_IV]
MTKTLLLILLFASSSFSQEKAPTTTFEYTDQVSRKIDELKELRPEEYIQKVNSYRDVIEKYIDHKKRVCTGEFSTIILSSQGTPVEGSRIHLNNEERELCFRELKALQINFVNNMYVARRKFLDSMHEKRIEELSKAREEALGSINATFAKKQLRATSKDLPRN